MFRIVATILLLVFGNSFLAFGTDRFISEEFIYKGDILKYRVLYPENYDSARKYPLVLFLHGAGERGNDNEKQLLHGASMFLEKENRLLYPSIVLFPQCPEDSYWINFERGEGGVHQFHKNPTITKSLNLVKKLTDSYLKAESIDKKRVYVMGLSMRGMATFDLIVRYPRYFAAAVPICGGVHTARLKRVRKMPIRMFHGSADPIVSRDFSQNAYIELKARGSGKVEYVEFPGVGHDSWSHAFAYPDFFGWIFYQTR